MLENEKNLLLNALVQKMIFPYIIIAAVLVLLAILIRFASLPEAKTEENEDDPSNYIQNKTSIFQFPHLLLGAFTLFLYVGVEVMAGNTIIGYGAYLGIPLSSAKFFTSLTLGCMLLGYVIGIICIPKYF